MVRDHSLYSEGFDSPAAFLLTSESFDIGRRRRSVLAAVASGDLLDPRTFSFVDAVPLN